MLLRLYVLIYLFYFADLKRFTSLSYLRKHILLKTKAILKHPKLGTIIVFIFMSIATLQ